MPIQSSFPTIADQVVTSNKNIVEILGKINSIVASQESSVTIKITDENGVLRTFSLPTVGNLRSEIDRLNANINSLYSVDAAGALIQTTTTNKWKKVISVDLNREPNAVGSLGAINQFKAQNNWFFDGLLSPMISVELDLTGKVEDNVRKIVSRRYMVDFAKDASGNLTPLGQAALNSFNTQFRGNSSINITDFEDWHKKTPGVVEPLNPNFDEQMFDLDPHELLYDGEFNVIKQQEDRLNRKLWYQLNTLDYLVRSTNQVAQLAVGSELIINSPRTSTRYKVIEVSKAESLPRVRLERVEGIEPIAVGIGTLKIYSPVIYTKTVKISVGYNERTVIFVKPMNADNHLVARNWSLGTGFWTNDLRLSSEEEQNGLTMEQFYVDYVYDYGGFLKDLVSKKIPNTLAGTPVSPTLNADNFKVVQINKHLTDTPNANTIKQKRSQALTLKSEIQQIQDAVINKNKKSKFSILKSLSDKKQFSLEIDDLTKKKDSKTKLYSGLLQEIISLSNNKNLKVDPKFRVRGFWKIPDAIVTRGTRPQEIVQFRVQYRYLSKDGKETPVETFQVDTDKTKAAFSNWIEFKTDARQRKYYPETGAYAWEIVDVEKADTPNINQLDLSIQSNEKVEVRIKSISEVGWPESPVESDWSDTLTIEFPDDLNNVVNETDFVLKEATAEDLKVQMSQELTSKGLDNHLADTVVINNVTYHHDAEKILSGFTDANGTSIDLYTYLKGLQDKITSLEEKIARAKGELQVIIYRNNQEFILSNGSETTFNVECEDYATPYTDTGVPGGRVYANNIYVIKDFVMKVRNNAASSPLGLLSNRTYVQSSDFYNTSAPQTFWVNNQDELITSDITGVTKTQLNYQYIWMSNFETVSGDSVTRLSENIGNNFQTKLNNSIANMLGATDYNIGYNETSILSFIGNNKSLLDPNKWVDETVSVSSTTKLLSTIHPVISNLEQIVETNSEKVKTINAGDNNSVIIPLNIYFKFNALDNNQAGVNYSYVNFNLSRKTTKHVKKLKFFIENEADNKPFVVTIKFNLSRNKVIQKKTIPTDFNILVK